MITYRNNKTGNVVDVPEARDIVDDGTDVAARQIVHQRDLVEKMDDSKKWVRADGTVPAEED